MKIFVAGASGRVGQELVKILVKEGHDVLAGSRHPETFRELENLKPTFLDLNASVSDLEKLLAGVDVVYFTAGSRGSDLLQTDLNGAVKLMEASESANVKRYIQLSSLFAMDQSRWSTTSLTDYNISKYFSDHWLVDKVKLDYTILQPGSLTEKAGTGRIAVDVSDTGENPIEDVAQTLADIKDMPNTIKKVISMHSGDVPIRAALLSIK